MLLSTKDLLNEVDTPYNKDAVAAIKSMFSESFLELYNASVSKNYFFSEYFGNVLESFFEDIISRKISTVEDVIAYLGVGEDLSNIQKSAIEKNIENIQSLDKQFLACICAKVKYISKFYPVNFIEINRISIYLATYFNNFEQVESYLSQEVDFSSQETLKNDIYIVSNAALDLSKISDEDLVVWRDLNAKFGKESIKLFMLASSLNELDGFSISEIVANFSGREIIKQLQEAAKNIILEKESEINGKESEINELASLCRKYYILEKTLNKTIEEVLPLKKTEDNLPNICFAFNLKGKKYSFAKVKPGSLEGLFLGKETNCCQFIGGHSEQCAVDGFSRADAGFYVIRDNKGKIKAQSYAWIGVDGDKNQVIVFDSFEYLPEGRKLFIPAIKKFLQELEKTKFSDLYVGTGGETPLLNILSVNDINPLNNELFRYRDSSYLYKIKHDEELVDIGKATKPEILIHVSDYKEFCKQNTLENYQKLMSEYGDDLGTEIYIKIYFTYCSNIFYSLLRNQSLTIETLSDFLSRIFAGEAGFFIFSNYIDTRLSFDDRVSLINSILSCDGKRLDDCDLVLSKVNSLCNEHPYLLKEIVTLFMKNPFTDIGYYEIPEFNNHSDYLNNLRGQILLKWDAQYKENFIRLKDALNLTFEDKVCIFERFDMDLVLEYVNQNNLLCLDCIGRSKPLLQEKKVFQKIVENCSDDLDKIFKIWKSFVFMDEIDVQVWTEVLGVSSYCRLAHRLDEAKMNNITDYISTYLKIHSESCEEEEVCVSGADFDEAT